ncbi:MAG: hypothetical protein FJ039_07380 [Chloroflexi bacterium]|nr:hypothetical protein [Chloroflexota bacterium]
MSTYSGSVMIGRPISEVFAYMAVPENAPQWMPDVVRVDRTTPDPLTLGSRFQETRKTGPGMKETFPTEVTKWIPDKEMGFVATGASVTVIVSYSLASAGDGTRVDYAIEFKWRGAAYLTGILFGSMIRRTLQKNHQRLKACVESVPK